MKKNKAVFLDRDGVVIKDVGLITDKTNVEILDGAPAALKRLKENGYLLIIISNQAVIARGLCSEKDVDGINLFMNERIRKASQIAIDYFYYCPHHPNADVSRYRLDCECRKPRPGLLLRAAEDHAIDLQKSFMIGDRMSDIVAGSRAGCKTIWLKTGHHHDEPIVSSHHDPSIKPDYECDSLGSAAGYIIGDES